MEACAKRDGRPGHIVTCVTEHVAVQESCKYLEARGFTVTYVGVDAQGRVSPDAVVAAVTPATRLVTIMLANVRIHLRSPCFTG
jgi:cysteine desulfurase